MPRALRAIGTKKPVQTGQMRKKGVEPIHPNREQEPESCASTNFATFAYEKQCKTTATTNRRRHALYSRTPPYASFFLPLRAFCRFFGTLYVAVAPYELFFGARALCRYRSIRARGRPIGKADTGRLQLRYCPQAANTLRYRPIACGNTGSRALYVAIAPYELGGRLKPLLPSSKTAASAMNGRYKARLWMIA